jgi:ABC-type dipeptide/oligopeptide/nickel transport system permease component
MLQRVVASLGTLWLAVTLTFVLLRLVPGDAIAAQFQDASNPQAVELKRAALGLDQPLPMQYVSYWVGLARGDLGVSLASGLPVSEILALRWPGTLSLTGAGMLFAIVFGLGAGTAAAWGDQFIARLAAFYSSLALSIPAYWTATLAFLFLGNPAYSLLPAVIIGLHSGGVIAQIFGGTLREVRHADYIRAARGKGLPESAILRRHALRPALAPVVMVMALQTGYLMSGAILTEMIFQRYGVGLLLRDSVLGQDYPVVQGIVVVLTGIYVLLTFAAEMAVWWLDPRVRGA